MTRAVEPEQHHSTAAPMLVCVDGSAAATHGMDLALELLRPNPIVVLSVWLPLAIQLAESGSVGVIATGQHESFDATEESAALAMVARAADRAKLAGREVTTRVARTDQTVWQAIVAVADEIDAALIVSGTRGRGPVTGMLLGSVSHAVLNHARRPVLIAPLPA